MLDLINKADWKTIDSKIISNDFLLTVKPYYIEFERRLRIENKPLEESYVKYIIETNLSYFPQANKAQLNEYWKDTDINTLRQAFNLLVYKLRIVNFFDDIEMPF